MSEDKGAVFRLVALLTILNILNYMDRYLVQAVQPILKKELAITLTESGYLISAFVVGYLIFSPIFGVLGDRYSRPVLMAFGALLWSLATVFTGMTSALWSFALARVAVGVGEASFGTLGPGYLKDRIKSVASLNLAFAAFFSAIPVGAALGYVFGGIVAAKMSWQWVFFLGGAPGIVLALILLKFTEVRENNKKPVRPNIRLIFKSKVLLFAIIGYIFNNFALVGVGAFISQYGVDIGFKLQEITTSFGIVLVVAGLLGTFGGGKLSSRLAEKSENQIATLLLFVAVTSFIGVPLLSIALTTENHTVFLTLCFFAELCIFAGVAPINSVIVLTSPADHVSFVQGITIALINLFGSFLAPILVGTIADNTGLPLAMQLCTVSLFLCSILWLVAAKFQKICK